MREDVNIPILSLIMDEQTGKAGYLTRLEAFVDLMRRKKMRNKLQNQMLQLQKKAANAIASKTLHMVHVIASTAQHSNPGNIQYIIYKLCTIKQIFTMKSF